MVNQYKNRDKDDQIVRSDLHYSYYSCTCNILICWWSMGWYIGLTDVVYENGLTS